MGLTIGGIVEIGRPLFPHAFSLGNIVALVRANIDKSLLDSWIDVLQLQEKFPTRIHLDGSMVSLKGPVVILKSITTLKVALTALIGVGTSFLLYKLSMKTIECLAHRRIMGCADLDQERIKKISLAVAAVGFFAATIVTYCASNSLPIEPGIYFLT